MIGQPEHAAHIRGFCINKIMRICIFLKNIIKRSGIVQIFRDCNGKGFISCGILFCAEIQPIVKQEHRAHNNRKEYRKTKIPHPSDQPRTHCQEESADFLAVPGTERKRTRLNAPATATPVPIFPLTSMITTQTTAGRSASVTTNFWYIGYGTYKRKP